MKEVALCPVCGNEIKPSLWEASIFEINPFDNTDRKNHYMDVPGQGHAPDCGLVWQWLIKFTYGISGNGPGEPDGWCLIVEDEYMRFYDFGLPEEWLGNKAFPSMYDKEGAKKKRSDFIESIKAMDKESVLYRCYASRFLKNEA